MSQALEPEDMIVTAINHLRRTPSSEPNPGISTYLPENDPVSKRFKLGALTNNFAVPGETPFDASLAANAPPPRPVSTTELRNAVMEATRNPEAKGAPTYLLRTMFDEFVESAVEGKRYEKSLILSI